MWTHTLFGTNCVTLSSRATLPPVLTFQLCYVKVQSSTSSAVFSSITSKYIYRKQFISNLFQFTEQLISSLKWPLQLTQGLQVSCQHRLSEFLYPDPASHSQVLCYPKALISWKLQRQSFLTFKLNKLHKADFFQPVQVSDVSLSMSDTPNDNSLLQST